MESTFLNGKVVKRTLPPVQPNSGADQPVLKRLILPQGELAQFYDGDEGIKYIAAIELKEGSARGNHYHKTKKEYVYMIGGEVALIVEELGSKAREIVELQAGDLVLIHTGVAHALEVKQTGLAVEFSPNKFDPEDIFRFKLE